MPKAFDKELQKNLQKIRERQKEKRQKLREKYKKLPEQEKDNLKKRLKMKIENKKNMRINKNIKKNKMVKHTFTPGNSVDIYTSSRMMMEDVKKLYSKGIDNILLLDKMLTDKYKFLKEKYFAIYRAILRNELPIEVLLSMLKQSERIKNNEITEEKASLEMGSMFAKKLNVDVDALVQSGLKNKAEMEKNNN